MIKLLFLFACFLFASVSVANAEEENEDLLLTSILVEFMKDSEFQLVLDLDLFRSLLPYSPARLNNNNDAKFWWHLLTKLEELKHYDISAPCLADLSHLVWQMIELIKNKQQLNQCDRNCSCAADKSAKIDERLWVLKVIDAMGKIPAGILSGNNLFAGSWETCRKIAVEKNRQGQMWRGQYCMAYLQPYNKDNPLKAFHSGAGRNADQCRSDTDGTTIEADQMKCFDVIPLLNYGLCVPNTCTDYDIGKVVQFWSTTVEKLLNRTLVCNTEIVCHNGENTSILEHNSSIWMLSFVIITLALMFFGSFYDYFAYQEFLRSFPESENVAQNMEIYDMQPWFIKVLLAFSVYNNGKNILRAKKGANQIHCLHGIRVLSMFWIILGHTYYYIVASLTVDNLLPTLVDFPLRFANQIIIQAPLAVDTFFFLSGMLMAFLWFRITKKMKGRNVGSAGFWGQFYFHRYMRLTPIYVIIMGLDVTIFSYFSDGPFWRPIERNFCRKAWWTNLIYLNNFLLQHVEVCMGWTWYLANDFQFYCFAPILLILLWKYDKLGIAFSFLLIFVSSAVKLAIIWTNDYPPAPILTKNLQIVHHMNDYWQDVYIKPYIRCGPYISGVLVGYFLYKYGLEVKLKKWFVILGWSMCTIAGFVSVFGLFNYAKTGEISRIAFIAYTLLGRNAYAFSLSWISYACATGYGGPINAFLSWKAWMPLSRITFSAYLFHPILLQIYYYSRPDTFHYSAVSQILSIFFAVAIVSYFCAFFLTCAFETPVGILEKLAIDRLTRSKNSSEKANDLKAIPKKGSFLQPLRTIDSSSGECEAKN